MNGHTETVGLIAAMAQESNALLRYFGAWERSAIGPFRGVRFHLAGRDCRLVTCGMGLTRAAQGARAILAAGRPQLLVSFGIAGAVNDDLDIGDVVVAGETCLWEDGQVSASHPLTSLSERAWGAAAQALQPLGSRLLTGTAITTRGSQIAPRTLENFAHPVLEMETAGIARVAAEAGVPLLSVRAISDGPQAPIPFDLAAVLDDEANFRVGKMLSMLLRDPGIVLKGVQMMRNSRIAADHGARALVAALRQPSPVISM